LQPDIVSLVSGGPSASQVDLRKIHGTVIGVNNAALHMPRIDHAITMDRRWAEAHWHTLKDRNELGSNIQAWFRRNNVCNIHERPEWLTIYKCNHKTPVMSDEIGTLNGTNSGGVALNLAYHLRPKVLFLFGFDYRKGPKSQWHWFEAKADTGVVGAHSIHEGRYANWAREFDQVGPQFKASGIDVVNVSETSLVTAFRKISPKEFMKEFA
jgi:hypothetical protein